VRDETPVFYSNGGLHSERKHYSRPAFGGCRAAQHSGRAAARSACWQAPGGMPALGAADAVGTPQSRGLSSGPTSRGRLAGGTAPATVAAGASSSDTTSDWRNRGGCANLNEALCAHVRYARGAGAGRGARLGWNQGGRRLQSQQPRTQVRLDSFCWGKCRDTQMAVRTGCRMASARIRRDLPGNGFYPHSLEVHRCRAPCDLWQ